MPGNIFDTLAEEESAAPARAEGGNIFDQLAAEEKPTAEPEKTSWYGAFGRAAGQGIAPNLAFGAAFGPTFKGVTALSAPTGPAAPFIGTAAALPAGIAAAKGAQIVQNKALETLAPESAKRLKELSALDEEQHFWAQLAGELISAWPAFKFQPGTGAKLLKAAIPAIRGVATEAEKKILKEGMAIVGLGASVGAGMPLVNPLLEGRLPTAKDLPSAKDIGMGVAFPLIYGHSRIPADWPGQVGRAARSFTTPKAPVPESALPAAEQFETVWENRAKGLGAVEVLERSTDGKTALVRPVDAPPDSPPETVPVSDLRRTQVLKPKGPNAIPEQKTGTPVRGVPEQPRQGAGELPFQEGGGGLPSRNVPPGKAPGRKGVGVKKPEVPLTPEAQELVQNKQGVPAFVSANLERIATENGIENIKGKTPNQIIDELRQRAGPKEPALPQTEGLIAAEQTKIAERLKDPNLGWGERAKLSERQGQLEAASVEAAERAAIDAGETDLISSGVEANKKAGLPAEVLEGTSDDPNVPFARTVSTTDAQGRILINRDEFSQWLADVPEARRPAAVRALFSEEGIHSAARKVIQGDELAALWQGLTGPERALVRKSYTGRWGGKPEGRPKGFTDEQMGHEYLRRVMQRAMREPVREVAESGRWSEKVIDIVERIIGALRKLTGNNAETNWLRSRLEKHLEANKTGANKGNVADAGQAPEAYRKGKGKDVPKEQLGFDLLPKVEPGQQELPAGAERPIQFGMPSAESIGSSLKEHLQTERPNFKTFVGNLQKKLASVTEGKGPLPQHGQLREAWEDAVWTRLSEASAAELGALAKSVGVEGSLIGQGRIGEKPRTQGEIARELAAAPLTKARNLRKEVRDLKGQKDYTPEQRARSNAIARIGEKLIRESQAGGKALRRKVIEPGEVGYWRKTDVEPYHEITPAELKKPKTLGDILTDGAASNRTGKGAPSSSVTKRVVALQNERTGTIDLVSIYKHPKGEVMIADPMKAALGADRPHVPLAEFMARKSHKPLASVLLDEPVQNFHQRFASADEFRTKFGDIAKQEQTKYAQYAEGEMLAEQLGGDDRGQMIREEKPGVLESGARRPLTAPETKALFDHLGDELKELKTAEDVSSAVESLKTKAEDGTLTNRDRVVINALQKIVRDIEHENPKLKGTNEAVELAFERIREAAVDANQPEDFGKRLGLAEKPLGQEPELPGSDLDPAVRQRAKNVRFQVKSVEAQAEAKRLNAELERQARLNGVPTDLSPEAFRKGDVGESAVLFGRAVASMFRRSPTEGEIIAAADGFGENANINGQQAMRTVQIASGQSRAGRKNKAQNAAAKKIREQAVAYVSSNGEIPKLQDFVVLADVGIQKARAQIAATKWGTQGRRQANEWLRGQLKLKQIAEDTIANVNDPTLQLTAKMMRRMLDQQRAAEVAAGNGPKFETDYVPGRYEGSLFNDDFIVFGEETFGKNYRAPRTFDSYWHAGAEGPFVAKNMDGGDLVGHRVRQGQTELAKGAFVDALKAKVDPTTQKQIAVDLVPSTRTGPKGGTLPGRPPSPYYEYFDMGNGKGAVAVLKGYKPLLQLLTGKGGISQSPLGEAMLHYSGAMKHGVQLIVDTFHIGRLGQYAKAIGFDVGYNRGFAALEIPEGQLRNAVQTGMITAEEAAWAIKRTTVAGQNLTNQELLKELTKGGLNVGRITDALYSHFFDNYPVIGKMNRWTFDRFTRGLMAETAVKGIKEMAEKFPNMPMQELVSRIAKDTNIYYGSLGRQGLFLNPTLREISQLLFLAPQWVEGLVRKEASFAGRVAAAPYNIAKGKPSLGLLGKGVGRGLVGYFLLTQAINLITRQQLTFQNDEEDHKFDAWIPDMTLFGKKTGGFWISPMSVFAEIFHDVLKYAKKKDSGWDAVWQIVQNKTGIFGKALLTLASAQSSEGKSVPRWKAVKELLPSPIGNVGSISLEKYVQAAGHAVAPSVVKPVPPGVLQRQLFGSAGIKIDPVGTSVQTIAQKAKAFMKEKGLAKEKQIVELYTEAPSYYNARRAIAAQDPDGAKEIIRDLLKDHTPAKMMEAQKLYIRRPYTDTKAHEGAFIRSLNAASRRTFQEARAQKVETVREFGRLLREVLAERRASP